MDYSVTLVCMVSFETRRKIRFVLKLAQANENKENVNNTLEEPSARRGGLDSHSKPVTTTAERSIRPRVRMRLTNVTLVSGEIKIKSGQIFADPPMSIAKRVANDGGGARGGAGLFAKSEIRYSRSPTI